MLEVLWKVVEAIIDTRIKTVVTFHETLNGFRASRGMFMAMVEINMMQELESINHDLLLLVSLDLQKEYDILECSRLLHTLEGYRAGPKIQGLLAEF